MPPPISRMISRSVIPIGTSIKIILEMLSRDTAAGWSAGLHGFVVLAVGNAAADLKDDFAQRDPHRHFDQPRVGDAPGQREDLGALALFRANRGEPFGPIAH